MPCSKRGGKPIRGFLTQVRLLGGRAHSIGNMREVMPEPRNDLQHTILNRLGHVTGELDYIAVNGYPFIAAGIAAFFVSALISEL